ncbi:hypothetical protein [Undibacterium sp. SXout20W]|uniref:hypothetical protein n=1 Tax=Undibacterium sp. SXout20W TaxID=3413051 RepID=UPI003BF0932D
MIQTLIDEIKEKVPANDTEMLLFQKTIDFFTPDWALWGEMPRATLVDTVMVSCGISPSFKKAFPLDVDKTNGKRTFGSITSYELTRRLKIAVASYRDVDFEGELSTLPIPQRTISTNAFYNWAKSKSWQLPDRFPHIAEDMKISDLDGKAKTTALRLIGGLAIGGYGMDIHAKRLDKLDDIVRDFEKNGISITSETMSKWIKEAAQVIEKPKSK